MSAPNWNEIAARPGTVEDVAAALTRELDKRSLAHLARPLVEAELSRLRRASSRRVEREAAREIERARREQRRVETAQLRERAEAAGFKGDLREFRDLELEAEWSSLSRQIEYAFEAARFTDAFLDSEFALGDGRTVSYRWATAEEHRARIDYMRAKIRGHEEDIELHQSILTMLETSGSACLASLVVSAQAVAS